MRTILFLYFFLILTGCNQEQELKVYNWDDTITSGVLGDKVHGLWTNKPITGLIIKFCEIDKTKYNLKAMYLRGQKHGEYNEWFCINGKLSIEESYTYGEKDGLCKRFWENGQIKEIGIYKKGEIDVSKTWYYENGKIRKRTIKKASGGFASVCLNEEGEEINCK